MQDHAHYQHVDDRHRILEKVAVPKSDPVLKPKERDVFFEEWPYHSLISRDNGLQSSKRSGLDPCLPVQVALANPHLVGEGFDLPNSALKAVSTQLISDIFPFQEREAESISPSVEILRPSESCITLAVCHLCFPLLS